jgi:hypothetical protein
MLLFGKTHKEGIVEARRVGSASALTKQMTLSIETLIVFLRKLGSAQEC